MKITSKFKDYSVSLQPDFTFMDKLKCLENTFFVIDKKVYNLYFDKLFFDIPEQKLFTIEAIEENKTVETALKICEMMTSLSAKRNSHIISIGGGIIQDITGFAANILYRGIKWTFIPTTLLAACDSCIGGKTSLNYLRYKNLLGTFYPPDEIYINSAFFETLSEIDFRSGLGEVVKFNIMRGEDGLTNIESNLDKLLDRDKAVLNTFVESSLLFKKGYIEEDEFDKGIRIHLNFAHTFGHAIETVTNYGIPHGIAVAMGTIIANRISLSRGIFSRLMVIRIEKVIRQIVTSSESLRAIDFHRIVDAIRKDKKQTNTALTAVLLYDNMKLSVVNDLTESEIYMAFDHLVNFLRKGV